MLKVDPETGQIQEEVRLGERVGDVADVVQVKDKLWVADGWQCVVHVVDPDRPEGRGLRILAVPCQDWSVDLTMTNDGIWQFDAGWFDMGMPILVKSELDGKSFLEW